MRDRVVRTAKRVASFTATAAVFAAPLLLDPMIQEAVFTRLEARRGFAPRTGPLPKQPGFATGNASSGAHAAGSHGFRAAGFAARPPTAPGPARPLPSLATARESARAKHLFGNADEKVAAHADLAAVLSSPGIRLSAGQRAIAARHADATASGDMAKATIEAHKLQTAILRGGASA